MRLEISDASRSLRSFTGSAHSVNASCKYFLEQVQDMQLAATLYIDKERIPMGIKPWRLWQNARAVGDFFLLREVEQLVQPTGGAKVTTWQLERKHNDQQICLTLLDKKKTALHGPFTLPLHEFFSLFMELD